MGRYLVEFSLQAGGVVLGTALVTAALLTALLGRRARPDAPDDRAAEAAPEPVYFLFRGNVLVDATEPARKLLAHCPARGSDWADLAAGLRPRFPEMPESAAALDHQQRLVLAAEGVNDSATLTLDNIGARVRVELRDRPPDHADLHQLHLSSRTARRQREILDQLPCPTWHTDPEGHLLWANRAYHRLAAEVLGPDRAEGAPLFHLPSAELLNRGTRRTALTLPADRSPSRRDEQLWYDVTTVRDAHGRLHYAYEIGAVVEAEAAQRNFVQTLTKTFAQLSTGLAIFDRRRQLALFNPALMSLTGLEAEFLAARPHLHAFFDQLRDRQVMPEPKSYASWREHLDALVSQAEGSGYAEVWTLPSGLTYKVDGRPHPDGAVAFLFEDISSEVSMARRFYAQISETQSVLDCLEEGIAVFGPDRTLTGTNTAYGRLWGGQPEVQLDARRLEDFAQIWAAEAAQAEAFAQWLRAAGEAESPPAPFALRRSGGGDGDNGGDGGDGGALDVHLRALQGGGVVVRFTPQGPPATSKPARPRTAANAPAATPNGAPANTHARQGA